MSSLPPIDALLPQRPPMRLVDRVASFSGEEVRTESRVRADWPFAVEGVIDSATCLEVMTQTAAAYVALAERATPSERAGIPMLVRVQSLRLHAERITVGELLETSARLCEGDSMLGRFEATVWAAGQPRAEASFTVGRFAAAGMAP